MILATIVFLSGGARYQGRCLIELILKLQRRISDDVLLADDMCLRVLFVCFLERRVAHAGLVSDINGLPAEQWNPVRAFGRIDVKSLSPQKLSLRSSYGMMQRRRMMLTATMCLVNTRSDCQTTVLVVGKQGTAYAEAARRASPTANGT